MNCLRCKYVSKGESKLWSKDYSINCSYSNHHIKFIKRNATNCEAPRWCFRNKKVLKLGD